MTTAIERLRVLEYEAEYDPGESPDQEEGRVIGSAEVDRLLQGASEPAPRDQDGDSVLAIEATGEGDALAGMRGVMIGLAWVTPFWALIAAIVWLT